jgi:hypothetical protein
MGSMTNTVNLCRESSVEKHDNLAEVVGATVHQKHRIHENPNRIAASAQDHAQQILQQRCLMSLRTRVR